MNPKLRGFWTDREESKQRSFGRVEKADKKEGYDEVGSHLGTKRRRENGGPRTGPMAARSARGPRQQGHRGQGVRPY